ncbi:unnamed protein product [Cyprideis torosa]|uniref:Uncharacterized protein n=1 Tax=Cyprideis torosa TaxID=163714 RepID=A0A7R8WA44_9CRUS|nr:unnamed protein product [Cyprideis torosa]CAG0887993.1 unnamed protein product [Cyprideis torosa]
MAGGAADNWMRYLCIWIAAGIFLTPCFQERPASPRPMAGGEDDDEQSIWTTLFTILCGPLPILPDLGLKIMYAPAGIMGRFWDSPNTNIINLQHCMEGDDACTDLMENDRVDLIQDKIQGAMSNLQQKMEAMEILQQRLNSIKNRSCALYDTTGNSSKTQVQHQHSFIQQHLEVDDAEMEEDY